MSDTLRFVNTLRASRAFYLLDKDMESGLGHAYMIVSPDDDVMKEFFTLIAARIYCRKGRACMKCTGCKKVLNGNHEDLTYVNPTGEKIKVQEIKDLVSSVSIKPLGSVKAYFVFRADLMTPEAQNKLLKTLEEPPEGVAIFLGVANETGLLDTVRSRCRKIYIDVFDRETVFNTLKAQDVDDEKAAVASSCCEGQLGRAMQIAASPVYAERFSDSLTLLERLQRSRDVLSAEAVPSLANGGAEFLKVLAVALRDVISAKRGEPLFFGAETASRIENIAERYSLRALALAEEAVDRAQRKLSFSVNPQAVTDSLLFEILEVRHKWQ